MALKEVINGILNSRISSAAAALAFWAVLNPQTPAELSAGITPNSSYTAYPYDVRRVGLIPNSPAAATANTSALKFLWDPTLLGPVGTFIFPNTTGADTYYFNGVIPIRDGVHVELNNCTINYAETTDAADNISGLFFALRDVSIEDGTINVQVNTAQSSSGFAIQFGARGTESSYFTAYDSLLALPQGNCRASNLRINIDNTGANLASSGAIGLCGGLQNVTLEDIDIDGGGNVGHGVAYEYGWATSGTTNLRETSHAHNLTIRNVKVNNLSTAFGYGVVLGGAYNFVIENLKVNSAFGIVSCTPGESLNYRPWANVDTAGAKRTKKLRQLTGENITGTAIILTGAQLASGGYLSAIIAALPAAVQNLAQTDLSDYDLDGFVIENITPDFGVLFSGGFTRIANGTITGCANGIVGTDEGTRFLIEGCNITACTQAGMRFTVGSAIYSPARKKMGLIQNCYIAGNSTGTPGAYPAIDMDKADGIRIQNCRFGKEVAYDGSAETTQGNGVQLGATCANVVCSNNYCGGVFGASFAYYNVTSTAANGNTVEYAGGVITQSGAWLNTYKGVGVDVGDNSKTLTAGSDFETQLWATALTGNKTVTLSTTNAKQGDKFRIVRSGLGAFTLDVGGLKTIAAGTAAFVDVAYNGAAWKLAAYGPL